MGLSMIFSDKTTWLLTYPPRISVPWLLSMATWSPLFDAGLTDDLAEPDHPLSAKPACYYLDSIFHKLPVLLIFSTVSCMNARNSGLELLLSCQTPQAQKVSSFSSPRGAAWASIHR